MLVEYSDILNVITFDWMLRVIVPYRPKALHDLVRRVLFVNLRNLICCLGRGCPDV